MRKLAIVSHYSDARRQSPWRSPPVPSQRGSPASAQPDPSRSGSAQSMPQRAATMQNAHANRTARTCLPPAASASIVHDDLNGPHAPIHIRLRQACLHGLASIGTATALASGWGAHRIPTPRISIISVARSGSAHCGRVPICDRPCCALGQPGPTAAIPATEHPDLAVAEQHATRQRIHRRLELRHRLDWLPGEAVLAGRPPVLECEHVVEVRQHVGADVVVGRTPLGLHHRTFLSVISIDHDRRIGHRRDQFVRLTHQARASPSTSARETGRPSDSVCSRRLECPSASPAERRASSSGRPMRRTTACRTRSSERPGDPATSDQADSAQAARPSGRPSDQTELLGAIA